ncbi:MAG: DUF5993 family protein [Acidimicrobiia bacterium]|nr:DUF5993 family protein [Acidimicrobiia bacterium]
MIAAGLFGLILATVVVVLRGAPRGQVLLLFGITLLAMGLLFRHHMTDPLGLSF